MKKKKTVCAELFSELVGTKNLWEVWKDLIFLYAVEISNIFDTGKRREKREKEYIRIMNNYSFEERQKITELFCNIMLELTNNPRQDLLGQLYMELSLGNERNGQFFTPYNVAVTMAESMDDSAIFTAVKDKGFAIINEPACGGGANLIAIANKLKSKIDVKGKCIFIAQDIDTTTALMCYIQLSIMNCAGYVQVGDSLKQDTPFFEGLSNSKDIWVMPMMYLRKM